MTRSDLRTRDLERLALVHPDCKAKVIRVLLAMDTLGFSMTVTDTLRTTAQQVALYAQGRTAPGGIVTNADGITTRSNHQAATDGFGHAVDCTFLDEHLAPTWSGVYPWDAYGACAEAVGLKWGGTWKIPDRPHLELP